MLTHDFETNSTLVKLKYANERLDAFNEALIVRALSSIYGEVGVDMQVIRGMANATPNGDKSSEDQKAEMSGLILARMALDPAFDAAFTIYDSVKKFAKIAVRVAELHADGFDRWIKVIDAPAVIDQAFQHYLGNQALWEAIEGERVVMDRPNGVVGAMPSQLSEAEREDPLSVNSGTNGKRPS
jgi:hypothetical protein